MIAGKQCPLCHQEPTEYYNNEYKICQCKGRILLSWPYETVADYENIYNTSYHDEFQTQHGLPRYIERYENDLTAAKIRLVLYRFLLGESLKICDVGAGNGAFVRIANAVGYDPTPMNEKIIKGGWSDVCGEFSLITLHDVIEHLVDPMACLLHLKTCLTYNGTLVVELPEFDSLNGEKHLRPEQHLFLPDETAIRELFNRCGLKVMHMYRPHDGRLGKFVFFLKCIN